MRTEDYYYIIQKLYFQQTKKSIFSNKKLIELIIMMLKDVCFSTKNQDFKNEELKSQMEHLIDIYWVEKVEVVPDSGNYCYQIRDIFKDKFYNFVIENSLLVSDIRNKLGPIKNFVALVEAGASQEMVFKNIEALKDSMNYLTQHNT